MGNVDGFLTAAQAGLRLGLSRRRVYQLIQREQLEARWIEAFGQWVIEEKEVERFAKLARPGHRPAKSKKAPPS